MYEVDQSDSRWEISEIEAFMIDAITSCIMCMGVKLICFIAFYHVYRPGLILLCLHSMDSKNYGISWMFQR